MSSAGTPLTRTRREPPTFRRVAVRALAPVTPRLVRVTLAGPQPAGHPDGSVRGSPPPAPHRTPPPGPAAAAPPAVEWGDLPAGAAAGDALVAAVIEAAAELPAGARVWAAGEAAAVQRIRRH